MIQTILLAYDGSDHAERAGALAGDLAEKYGASLHVVMVVDHSHAPAGVSAFADIEHVDNPESVEAHAYEEQLLRPFIRRLRERSNCALQWTVLRGDPASTLIAHSARTGADLIVTGRRGKGRMEGLLIGSVSAKLTSHAECPVLTVK